MDAETRLYCLLGMPARHSLSPVMHNAGFRKLGINAAYMAFEPQNLGDAVKGLKELGAGGFNLTMPFKNEVIGYLDEVDEKARRIGAVNTVVNRGGKLVGYNTDGVGAVAALRKVGKVAGERALLLGAGGAGSAIAHALAEEKADVIVADRNAGKAGALAEAAGIGLADIAEVRSLDGLDIVINATPAGMRPNVKEMPVDAKLLRKGMVVFDIVYDPLETRLLKEARKRGCRTIPGIEMLLGQGFETFRLFTGRAAPEKEMRKAVMAAMG